MVAKGLNDKVAGSVIVLLPNDTTRSPDTLHKSKFILKGIQLLVCLSLMLISAMTC